MLDQLSERAYTGKLYENRRYGLIDHDHPPNKNKLTLLQVTLRPLTISLLSNSYSLSLFLYPHQ